VLGMGSAPSFDPNLFSKPISAPTYKRLFNSNTSGHPLFNRAVAGLYPTGSTFKPITATAALQTGAITPDSTIDDPGFLKLGVQKFKNAGGAVNGIIALRQALQVSSDVFFYTLGARLNSQKAQGGPLQTWARHFGIGRLSGIDLPGQAAGTIPSPEWRAQRNQEEVRCEKKTQKRFCGIADGRPWAIGDNVNLAVGQGDLQASPLQMAVAYAALQNGGRVVRPHLGLDIEDSAGRRIQDVKPPAERRLAIDPANRQAILDGLHLAASADGGTSADVFRGWDQQDYPVYGKTGTAERPGQADQSWYVCFVSPTNGDPPIVVAVTIEQGGFGAAAAAPAARLILSEQYRQRAKIVSGSSHTR
ncbi:MAG: hypothetical protein LC713_03395, partial [Actinobacteria bacterium]|nr:hypothetical protein [Actinomycetota bacterium]